MERFCETLYDSISQSYSLFNRVEQNILTNKRFNLSVSELHLLEAINKNPLRGRMIGDLANDLMVTPSSVTIAVNRLEKKGYVVRKKSIEDGRQVYVNLTDKGRHADRIHKRIHWNLAKNVADGMTSEERKSVLNCFDRINSFLTKRIKKDDIYKEYKKSA